jgi:geranylgeranyl diphosphate synthase type I
VGEAFQLRDDLLGAFGNPGETGKATGDDFRDGKQTLLVLLAAAWLDSGDRGEEAAALFARLGAHDISEDEICALQVLLEECGARAQLEQRIAAVTESAHEILPHLGLNRAAEVALADLADQAAWRMT